MLQTRGVCGTEMVTHADLLGARIAYNRDSRPSVQTWQHIYLYDATSALAFGSCFSNFLFVRPPTFSAYLVDLKWRDSLIVTFEVCGQPKA